MGGAGLGLAQMQIDDDGFSPMLFARANGHFEMAAFLTEFYDEMLAKVGAGEAAV